MPYIASNLISLVAADSFTLWLYKTTDLRATVLSPGYFSNAGGRLLPGHMVVVQAGDATSILPVRNNGEVGNGIVVDASSAPLRLGAAGSLAIEASLTASATARGVTLGAMPSGLNQGQNFTIQASASGATSTLSFSVLNAAGNPVLGPTSIPVAAGSATATFPAPTPGNGYRVKVEDAADALVVQLSPSFVVLSAFALLLESGVSLLIEAGGRVAM